ncbi:MAG: hypothetical protein ACT4PU_11185 [Planctomycetota bacterium]
MGRKNRDKRARAEAGRQAALLAGAQPSVWPNGLAWNFVLLTAVSVLFFADVFFHPTEMLVGSDLVRLHVPLKTVQYDAFWVHGSFPLWDPTSFCGRSIVGDPVAGVLNPLAWLFWVSRSPVMFGFYLWAYVTLGAWGAWLWMRSKGAAPVGAFVTAVAFALSGKSAAHMFAGHLELLPGMLCLPWVLWATERILQHPSPRRAVTLGAVLCVTATMGSVQSLYWHGLAVGCSVTWHAVGVGVKAGWRRALRPVGFVALGGLVFLLGAMAWWFPVVRQTLLLSARAGEAGGGFDFATMGSATGADFARLLWPFHGLALPKPLASDPENGFFWETASYPGLVALSLALLLLVTSMRDRRTRTLGLAALLCLLLSLGRNFPLYRLAYEVIPGFELFRVPARFLFYSNLFLAGLAGLGLGELLKGEARLRRSYVVVLAVLLALALGGSSARSSDSLAGSWLLSLAVLSVLLLLAILYSLGRLPTRFFAGMVVAVSLLDLGVVWSAHVETAPPAEVLRSNSVVEFLAARQAEDPSRFFDPTRTVSPALVARHRLESIVGYHPGIYRHQLEAYRSLWDFCDESSVTQLLMHSPKDIVNIEALDAMSVRYVVAFEPVLDDRFERVFTTPEGEFDRPRHVFERVNWRPRAWPSRHDTHAPGLLILAESWHPDWVAEINGEKVDVHLANSGVLEIPVGVGAHALRLWYWPWDFYLGCVVSVAFWLSVGVTLLLTQPRAGLCDSQLAPSM